MNRGVDRRAIFFGDADRVEFGRLLGVVHEEHGVEVHAYCLMDNHFHLLLHCPDGGLAPAMHRLLSVFVRHVNDRVGRDGPLFKGRYSSRLVTTEHYLLNTVRYIHRNALDVTGVDTVDRYRWSSHRTYLGHRRPPSWMCTEEILARFDGVGQFHRFVADDTSAPISVPTADTADEVLRAIAVVVGERSGSRPGGQRSEQRAIALALADQLPEADRRRLVDALGLEGSGAEASARSRARRLMAERPHLEAMVDAVAALTALPSCHLVPGTR